MFNMSKKCDILNMFVYVTHCHDVHLFPMPFGPFGQNIHIIYDLESHLICYDLISLLRRTL